MAKDRDDELNKDVPGGEEFSLESILAEFGGGPARKKRDKEDTVPFPIVPKRTASQPPPPKGGGRVVAFPSGKEEEKPGERSEKERPPVERQAAPQRSPEPEEPGENEEPEEDKVVDFPGEEGAAADNPIAEGLNRLVRKADDYAAHMFEEEGKEHEEEVRRAEAYIPGTDEEEEEERPRRERRPRRQPPPAPDLPAGDLARRYSKGLKSLSVRGTLVLLLFLPALYLSVDLLPYPDLLTDQLRLWILAAAQGLAMLLGLDVLIGGLARPFRLEFGMDTLLVFAAAVTLADTLTMPVLGLREGEMPYCAAIILGIALLLKGTARKRRGQRLACRTAASASQPYLVTLDEGKWNGRDTYTKWSGEPIGFGRQMQASDGAQRIFQRIVPLLLIASLLLSIVASIGRGAPERMLWCLSTMLTASASLSGALCFSLPWLTLCRRLSQSGAAIAGWDGVTATGGSGILLTDTDFFPPGCVSLNGIKVFGDFPVDKVVSSTASLIKESGCGLDKIFHDLLRSQGCVYRRMSNFCCYEGGLSAVIRNQQVLVGSAAFMHLMEIPLPPGLNVKNAVFCAIDGELAGIFALNYTLHGTLEPSLNSLIRNRVTPVMATRDFNLIPAMLRQRFKLPVDKMEFPAAERRIELSDEDQEHSDILTAVLCREGVAPYSEAVVGAARLRRAVRISALLASLGAVAGLLLAFYLTFVGSYASLSAGNLLVFLVMWLVPTPLISGMVNKY